MRLRRKPWTAPTIKNSPIGIGEPQNYKGRWDQYFLIKAPLHVELGTGRGNFITTMARNHPEINYLGIEMKPEALIRALFKAEDLIEQGNLGLVLSNINHIEDYFATDEVERLYINFCDPWPKKAHEKRRLTHRGFLDRYRSFLEPKSEIHFKTDNRELFEFSLNEFTESGFQLKNLSYDLHHSDYVPYNVMTEYEQKFSEMGLPIYRVEAVLE